jgi:formylglycine-generating enzyme
VPGKNANLAVYGCFFNGSGTAGVTNIAAVGSVSAGNGKYGQADLAGNVWEWVQDWPGTYPKPCINCANFTDSASHLMRGGSYNFDASYLLSSFRGENDPPFRHWVIGARCARTP